MLKRLLREFLFWTHVFIMLGAILIGLIVPFWAFAALAAGHRVHMVLCRGCVFSHLQKYLDCMPKDQTFVQHMLERFLKRPFNQAQAFAVEMMILFGAVSLALSRQFVL